MFNFSTHQLRVHTPTIAALLIAPLALPAPQAMAGNVDCSITDIIGTYSTPSPVYDITISGNRAYLALGTSGLQIYDISDPTSLVLLGTYDTPGSSRDVEVAGNIAYIADLNAGPDANGELQILDVTDPTSPAFLGSFHHEAWGYESVSIVGTTAYITNGPEFEILDVSDPASPSLLGSHDITLTTTDITVQGDIAYVTWWPLYGGGIKVFDVSDPTSPTLLGGFADGFSRTEIPQSITVVGSIAYVADDSFGLRIFDVSDPTSPSLLSQSDTPSIALNVTVVGTIAYVADSVSGLEVFDVSDPTTPVHLLSYDIPGNAETLDVAIVGNAAYLATSEGITVLDISNCSQCLADINQDGNLNFFDISAFLAAFAASEPVADFNNDNQFNFFDISAFLVSFAAGCP